MRSVEILAGGLVAGCLPVRPAGSAACATCHGALAPGTGTAPPGPGTGAPTCGTCRTVAVQLTRPLAPVTPVSLTTAGSRLHRALCAYKTGRPGAHLDARRLSGLLTLFLRRHMACASPGGADAVLVVPSLGGGRPAPHPLLGVLGGVPGIPPVLDWLVPGPGTVRHRRAAPDGFACARPLHGRRVLLVDDTYTSGAHLQSAAAAATSAGALVVHGLVVGRFVRGGTAPEDELLDWARARPWEPARCTRCAAAP